MAVGIKYRLNVSIPRAWTFFLCPLADYNELWITYSRIEEINEFINNELISPCLLYDCWTWRSRVKELTGHQHGRSNNNIHRKMTEQGEVN